MNENLEKLCGEIAGEIRLNSSKELYRKSFTSELLLKIKPSSFEILNQLLITNDITGLYNYDVEVASFYCPNYNACYCGKHWNYTQVFDNDEPLYHDAFIGICPNGHRRMLED